MTGTHSQLWIQKGATVWSGNQEYVVVDTNELDTLLARNLQTGTIDSLAISSLHAPPKTDKDAKAERDVDLVGVTRDDWDEAKRRLKAIQPLLSPRKHGDALAAAIAADAGVSVPTIYAWRNAYLGTGFRPRRKATKCAVLQRASSAMLANGKPLPQCELAGVCP